MKITRTHIPEVAVIEPEVFHDERGWVMESFNEPKFHIAMVKLGLKKPNPFKQKTHYHSVKHVVRGLNFQEAPAAQAKLIRVQSGISWHVAVDVRRHSPTYREWVGVELSEQNRKMLWIPEGFAHGFYAIEQCDISIDVTHTYDETREISICWDDPALGVQWPISDQIEPRDLDLRALSLATYESLRLSRHPAQTTLRQFDVRGDDRGSLIALEQGINIPFEIKRAYYIYDTKEEISRGFHAHISLQQMVICVAGSCRIRVDDGKQIRDIILDSPAKGLLIENLVWREMHDFTPGSVLMVFASEHYDESDYIRTYDAFLKIVKSDETS